MASVCVIGEVNLDLIVLGAERFPRPGEELIVDRMVLTLGSSSAILACQLARLGDDMLFISKTGDDNLGRIALDFLKEKGVATGAIIIDRKLTSGLTTSVALGGDRAMMTVMGCIEELRYDEVDFELLRGRQHLHISSFYLQRGLRPDVWRIFERARGMGLTTSFDTGWPSSEQVNGDLEKVWPHVDVFLPNGAEVVALSGQPSLESGLAWLAERVPLVAAKLGADGAMARRGEEALTRPAFVVDVVETTGAGDSFNGGFIHGWLSGMDLGECLDLGNACGALSTRAPGGTTSQATLEEAMGFAKTAERRQT
ncbi:MAG: carbohydrate kinase family protein [Armatimonadota bacterium]